MLNRLWLRHLIVGISVILSIFSWNTLQAQESLEEILHSTRDFREITRKADAYFEKKFPNSKPFELTTGPNRDGEYVKYMRWQSFWASRLTQDGKLGSLVVKKDRRAGMSSRSSSAYNNIPWKNVSHKSHINLQIGMGRTTSIGFHPTNPKIFYVGAAMGGIWKTEDGGLSYVPLGDDLPFLAVSAIVVNKNNPSIIHIAISDHVWYGSAGLGVYRTTNGGATWESTALKFNLEDDKRIYWLEAHPDNPDIIFAGTQIGLYKTTNGFSTVKKVLDNSSVSIRFKPGDPNTIYSGGRWGQIFISKNGGESFSGGKDVGNSEVAISVSPAAPNRVYFRHDRKLYRSYDSGENFSEVDLGESNMVMTMSHTDPDVIIAGNLEIHRSDDDGKSFRRISNWLGQNGLPVVHVDQRNVFINPLEPDYIYLCNDGGVFKYSINNNSFQDLSNGLQITQFYDIAVAQTNDKVIGGGCQDNGNMFRDANGDWNDYAPTGDGMTQDIDPTDHNIRYWTYQNGDMQRWSNGYNKGISPPGNAGRGQWETPFRLDPSNPKRLIAGYKKVHESLDRGDSWKEISPELDGGGLKYVAIAPSNPKRVYAASGWSVFVKNLNSNEWTKKSVPGINYITDIEIHPQDENTIYLSNGVSGAGKRVFKSTDAGDSWSDLTGNFPEHSAGCIELYHDKPGGMFVGTSAGVYYRDDSMNGWVEFGDLPHTSVRDIEINYAAKLVRAGTMGRGIFEASLALVSCGNNAPDADADGICDQYDKCPNFDDYLIGKPCTAGADSPFPKVYTENCTCQEQFNYCSGRGTSGTGDDWIKNVSFNTINNTSEKTMYSEFTDTPTRVEKGETHTLSVRLNKAYSKNKIFAWLDFNKNGVFESEEEINMSAISNSVSTASITIPNSAKTGVTGLRVRTVYSDSNEADPCGSTPGEVEDYAINISQFCDKVGQECTEGAASPLPKYYNADCLCEAGLSYCPAAGTTTTGADWIKQVRFNTIDKTSNKTTYSDFTSISTKIEKGETFTLDVQLNTSYSKNKVFAWIDFNKNGTFEDGEKITMSSPNSVHASKGTITIPSSAKNGFTGLRVRVVYSDSDQGDPCNVYAGEVEDYAVEIIEGKDEAGYCFAAGTTTTGDDWIKNVRFNTIDKASTKTTYSKFTDISTKVDKEGSYNLEVALNTSYSKNNVFAWIDFNQNSTFESEEAITMSAPNSAHVSNGTIAIPSSAQLGSTRLRVRVVYDAATDPCGGYAGEVEDYTVEIVEGKDEAGYCIAAGTATTGDDWIKNVLFNTIDKASEKTTYSKFTDISTKVEKEGSYNLEVALNTSFTKSKVFAWIDFNKNSTFESGEAITMSAPNSTHVSNGTIAIPSSAQLGSTRLRVRVVYDAASDPCGLYAGEVEDYTVEIVEGRDAEGYCFASGTEATGDDWIKQVQFNTIDKASEKTTYSKFTEISTQVEKGTTYTLDVSLNTSYTKNKVFAWIDFNNNSTFENGEAITMSAPNSAHVSNGTIAIPSWAKIGSTRLRVRVVYSDSDQGDPCSVYAGEVEDYTVEIMEGTDAAGYCIAAGTASTGDDWIKQVQFNTIDKTSDKTTYSDFTAITTEVEKGKSYTLEVALNTSYSKNNVFAWIDFNNNSTFESGEAITMSAPNSAHVSNGTIVIPSSAEKGLTRLRVRVVYDAASDPCGEYAGEVEDYAVEIVAGRDAAGYCIATGTTATGDDWIKQVQFNTIDKTSDKQTYSDFTAISTKVEKGNTYNLEVALNTSYSKNNVFAWLDFNNNKTFENGEAITMSAPNSAHVSNGTIAIPSSVDVGLIRLRVRVVYDAASDPCGEYAGEVEDYTVEIVEGKDAAGYCLAAGTASTGADWIKQVQFNTIDKTSDKTTYSDFTAISTEVIKENSYTLEVALNTSYSKNKVFAWLDFNHNGAFESGEAITMSAPNSAHVSNGTIAIPSSAKEGATRLRVRVVYSDSEQGDPCSEYSGEVEDYTVAILGSKYCTATGATSTGEDWIKKVQFNTIDNTSNKTRYSDFTNISTSVNRNVTYSLEVHLNKAYSKNRIFAWLDQNGDGVFEDGERIAMPGANSNYVSRGTIKIPGTTKLGATVLRVRVVYSALSVADPCGDYPGEVEDYTVEILENIDSSNYCPSKGLEGSSVDWIKNVKLNTINNTSAQSTYSNFTDVSTKLKKDTDYPISVQLNEAFDLDEVHVWLDYNQDEVFDEGEHIAMSAINDNFLSRGTIKIPATAKNGLTRLRVRVIYDGGADPCADSYGEVEDYTVDILGSDYCFAEGAANTGQDWIKNVSFNTINNTSTQTGYSAFTDLKTDVRKDSTYNLNVQLNKSYTLNKVYAWLDFNRNGVFNLEEKIDMSAINSDYQSSGSIKIPTIAKLGSTALRVRVVYRKGELADPCNIYPGEVEDYTINILDNCPFVGQACAEGPASALPKFYNNDCECEVVTCDEDSGDADSDGVCDVYDSCPNLDDNLIGQLCTDGPASPFPKYYRENCTCVEKVTYCSAAGTAGTGPDWIKNVKFNTINSTSIQTGYSDFTDIVTNVSKGDIYTLEVRLNTSFSKNKVYAWLDYNRDGAFDSEEQIIMSTINSEHISIGSITIPTTAELGLVGLRVRTVYSDSNEADPCNNYPGEVEDYGVNISEKLNYCSAKGAASTGDDWIKNVSFNTIDKTSTKSGYSDFTNLVTRVRKNDTYTLDVELNTSYSKNKVFAWLDVNKNGTFESGEQMVMSAINSEHKSRGTIEIPSTAALGLTALRVRVVYSTETGAAIADPCNEYPGEVEDYAVEILENTAPLNLVTGSRGSIDLFPNYTFSSTSFLARDERQIVVNINEIGGKDTDGSTIEVFIPFSDGFTFTYDPTQTLATIIAPESVNNADWDMTNTGKGYLFKCDKVLPARSRSRIAITVKADGEGCDANVAVNISPDAGGDENNSNNTAVLSQSIQKN